MYVHRVLSFSFYKTFNSIEKDKRWSHYSEATQCLGTNKRYGGINTSRRYIISRNILCITRVICMWQFLKVNKDGMKSAGMNMLLFEKKYILADNRKLDRTLIFKLTKWKIVIIRISQIAFSFFRFPCFLIYRALAGKFCF